VRIDPAAAAVTQALNEYLRTGRSEVPDILRPRAALREIVAVCESIDGGRSVPQPQDRGSLMADAQHAITALGDALRDRLQPALHDFFHGDLAQLPDLLADGGGRARLRGAATSLLERLRHPQAAQAAWRDVLSAIQSGGPAADEVRHLVLVLREIDESLGHEWLWRERQLRELASAGEFEDCEEILGHPTSTSAQVVWFVFADADLPDGFLRVGQVQFFSHRLWPDAARDPAFMSRVEHGQLPTELDNDAVEHEFPVHDSSDALVYARVELTGPMAEGARNPWAHGRPPDEWARELVAALVEAGTFRVGGSAWRLLDGCAVYHGTITDSSGTFGNWSSRSPFTDPEVFRRNRTFRHPLREGTGEALEEVDPRLAGLLASSDQTALHALEEVRWYQAARSQPDAAQRLVLHVRAFERALPVSRDFRWNDALKHYFREFWALDRLDDQLFTLAHTCYRTLSRSNQAELDAMEQWLVDESGDRFTIALGAFLREVHKLVPLLPRHMRLERRAAREAGRWAAAPADLRAALKRKEQTFSRLVARALRQRNAVVHGITTVDDVILTTDPFVAHLASFVVAQAVQSAAEGSRLGDAVARGRDTAKRVLWRLEHAEAPTDVVLYGADEI
jgi:hypothetical protein